MPLSASQSLISEAKPISQGAEAKVYKVSLSSDAAAPILLKYRFKKQYRHPSLDANLTRSRVAGEVRAILKCLRSGVSVPGIRMVDATEGVLGIEWIDGQSVRKLLPGGVEEDDEEGEDEGEGPASSDSLEEYGVSADEIMQFIGTEIAKMHLADIIHGDLTTSNMMLRHPRRTGLPVQMFLVDFGLAYHSSLTEDKAVDLYVLERAFSSTHPESEPLFASVLQAYEVQMGKDWSAIKRRLDDGQSFYSKLEYAILGGGIISCLKCMSSTRQDNFQLESVLGEENAAWWANTNAHIHSLWLDDFAP